MESFALDHPTAIADAASSASGLVAEAMLGTGRDAGADRVAILKAGGIDLLDLMKEGLLTPHRLVSLRDVAGLDGIVEGHDGSLRIGAMVTLSALAGNGMLRLRYPALADAAEATASPELRNVATLGGNLLQRPRCWYFRTSEFHCLRKGGGHCFALNGENQYHAIFGNSACAIVHPSTPATALVALRASIELMSADGASRSLLLEEFFVSPDKDLQRENDLKPQEILTTIVVPELPRTSCMSYMKLAQKAAFDWPLADVAVVLDLGSDDVCRQASIVLGAAAPTPYRAEAAQAVLINRHIDADVASAAAHAALTGATPLAMNSYKLPMFETLVKRALLKAATSI